VTDAVAPPSHRAGAFIFISTKEREAMTIRVACTRCRKQFGVSDEFAGRTGRCNSCGTPIPIPVPALASIPAGPRTVPVPQRPAASAIRPGSATPMPRIVPASVQPPRPVRRPVVSPRQQGGAWKWAVVGVLVFATIGGGAFGAWKTGLIGKPRPKEQAAAPAERATDTPAAMPADVRYLPDGADLIVTLDMDTITHSQTVDKAFQHVQKQLPPGELDKITKERADFLKQWKEKELKPGLGLAAGDLRRIVLGAAVTSKEYVFVITTHKDMNAAALIKAEAEEAKESKHGNFTIYETTSKAKDKGEGKPGAFCLVDGRTLVATEKKELLLAVLDRNRPAKLAPETEAVMKLVNPAKTFTLAWNPSELQKQQAMKPKDEPKPGTIVIDIEKMLPDEWKPLWHAKAVAVEFDVRTGFELSLGFLCKTEQDAATLKKAGDLGVAFLIEKSKKDQEAQKGTPEEAQSRGGQIVLEQIKVTAQGAALTARLGLDDKTIAQLLDILPKELPLGVPGN